MKYFDDWYRNIREAIEIDKRKALFYDVYDAGNGMIWLPSWQGNFIMEFNMNTCRYKLHFISELGALSSVVVAKNNMLLLERDFSVLNLLSVDEGLKRIEIDYSGFISKWGLGNLYLYEEYVYLFPLLANMILRYNRSTGEIQCVKELAMKGNYNFEYYKNYNMACCERISEEEVIYYSIPDSKIVKFNMKTCDFKELYTGITEEEQEYLKSKLLEKSFLEGNCEKESLRLDSFIECIQGKYKSGSDDIGENSLIYGKKIYQYLND